MVSPEAMRTPYIGVAWGSHCFPNLSSIHGIEMRWSTQIDTSLSKHHIPNAKLVTPQSQPLGGFCLRENSSKYKSYLFIGKLCCKDIGLLRNH